jgi:hypothetical protein
MAENSPYFEVITAQRSMLLTEEEALLGNTTISLETQADLTEQDVLNYIEENFAGFLVAIRHQSHEDQELLLSYYMLSKTQNILAIIHRTTQTLCSFLIRQAMARVGTFILLGDPTPESMKSIFLAHGLEDQLKAAPLSDVVALYSQWRSFDRVAMHYGLHRPDVRRAMRFAMNKLGKCDDDKAKALGAHLQGLLEKASASGKGFSKRKMDKAGHIYMKDPALLGDFHINIQDPDFHHLFIPSANR